MLPEDVLNVGFSGNFSSIFLKCLTFARLVLMMFSITQTKANYLHNPNSESHAQQSFQGLLQVVSFV
jgi:hypothetical protein